MPVTQDQIWESPEVSKQHFRSDSMDDANVYCTVWKYDGWIPLCQWRSVGDEPWHVTFDLNDLEEAIILLSLDLTLVSLLVRWWACHQIIYLNSGPLTLKLRRERSISLRNFWSMRGAIIWVVVFQQTIKCCVVLQYKRINTHFFMDTFFVTAKAVSEQKNTCMQLFVSDTGFMYVYPMKSKSEMPMAIKAFVKVI